MKTKHFIQAILLISVMVFTSCIKKAVPGSTALVLSGGGAKGAYQIGVWRAMNEYHISETVSLVSGTSVGSLNAALFATTTCDEAEKLWKQDVGYYSFMIPDFSSFTDIADYIKELCRIYNELDEYNKSVKSEDSLDELKKVSGFLSKTFSATFDIVQYILSAEHSGGLFKRDDLETILSRYIKIEDLKASGIKVYASALEKGFFDLKKLLTLLSDKKTVKYFNLCEQTSSENVYKILLASSALPVAYPSVLLTSDVVFDSMPLGHDSEYIDGGFDLLGGANTPIEPVIYNQGIKNVIVVYLESLEEMGGSGSVLKVDGKDTVINIIPSCNLGTIISGTVNFRADKIDTLISLGYKDACEAFERAGFSK